MSATIVAVATPPAKGGVGILRFSGREALRCALRLVSGVPGNPLPRHAYLTPLTDAEGTVLDEGLFLYFQAPKSFTGEDVVELQTHGSPRVLQMLQSAALSLGQVRLASPGEFSRRAFLNGRIDLTRAEAIVDLVAAESEAAVRAAAAQIRGSLLRRIQSIREPLESLRADVEGVLNFPEEADGAEENVTHRIINLVEKSKTLLADAGRGRLLRRGARVVLYGPVNAGKSTLFNRLVGDERALVDPEPGTTRDVLEGRLEIKGFSVTLVDTAGLRSDAGRLEAKGIERARDAVRGADLAILVLPPEALPAEAILWASEAKGIDLLRVRSKVDVVAEDPGSKFDVAVSAQEGLGVDELLQTIVERLNLRTAEASAMVSERHADALQRAVESLVRAHEASMISTLEVVAGELGMAREALAEITGDGADDELLDRIFQRFCIGK